MSLLLPRRAERRLEGVRAALVADSTPPPLLLRAAPLTIDEVNCEAFPALPLLYSYLPLPLAGTAGR